MNEPEPKDEAEGNRRMDPEVLILSRIMRMLDDVDTTARGRLVRYLCDRYAVQ